MNIKRDFSAQIQLSASVLPEPELLEQSASSNQTDFDLDYFLQAMYVYNTGTAIILLSNTNYIFITGK